MFKIRPVVIVAINFALVMASWIYYKLPQGDEYLLLYMIPLLFIFVPSVLSPALTAVLFALNIICLIFYRLIGVLNLIDVSVLTVLIAFAAGGGYLVKLLYASYNEFYKTETLNKQRKYNSIVNDLESINRRGNKVENELSRISRLYEVTKQLVPTLKQEELLDALFDFLEKNFKFQVTHLLAFHDGEFERGISKSTSGEHYYAENEEVLDYEKVIEYIKERDSKAFFVAKEDVKDLFDSMKIKADTFMAFPLFVGERLSAILAIEGASRASYSRFRILVSQIALEFRKVELYEQVEKLSIIDGLTEVHLRRYLMDRLEEEVERAGRLGLTFSIGMVDVDKFKDCNDKYGHLVGDAVLKKIAARLKKSVREVDMIARYGGEEFCILLPETPKDLAMTVAERLRKSIESKRIKAFDEDIRITVSVGIATYPEDAKEVNSLIEKADTALYKAKRKGRNAVCTV